MKLGSYTSPKEDQKIYESRESISFQSFTHLNTVKIFQISHADLLFHFFFGKENITPANIKCKLWYCWPVPHDSFMQQLPLNNTFWNCFQFLKLFSNVLPVTSRHNINRFMVTIKELLQWFSIDIVIGTIAASFLIASSAHVRDKC